MQSIKVVSIFGTRPEAIKMAPLVKVLEETPGIQSMVCITAQHRQMLDQVLDVFGIHADFDLNIMQHRQSIDDITTKVLTGISSILQQVRPDLVLVHGDTTTTFASSLAAFYNQIALGHVEAGLRSFIKYQPYPEEMNRKLTGVLADLHFAPTAGARDHLLRENVAQDRIYVTGNTVIDAMRHTVRENYVFTNKVLNEIDYHKRIITVTAHRRENLGQPLLNICAALKRIKAEYDDVEFVYPVHKNPAVSEVVYGSVGAIKGIHLIDPVDINDMHNLIHRSYIVMTDSGGIQEEAPSLNKPVVVLRNVTERPEGVDAGALVLAGTKEDTVVETVKKLLDDSVYYQNMAEAKNPFGDGFAGERIKDAICNHFKISEKVPESFLPNQSQLHHKG